MTMNLVTRNGNYAIWFSRTEAPPVGKLVSLRRIAGHAVTDAEEAEALLDAVKKERLEQKLIELDTSHRHTITELRTAYKDDRADLSPKTLANDDLALRLLADVVGEHRAIRTITERDLAQFKKVCLVRKCSPESVRTYFRHIKAALNWSRRAPRRWIDTLPEFPRVKAPRRVPRAIRDDALDDILAWLKKHDRPIWRYAMFALWTGCRLSEIIGLQYQNIIIYPKPKHGVVGRAHVIGKGDRERVVPLLPGAKQAIGKTKDIGPVFLQWSASAISHHFKHAVREAGFEAPHFHQLRHTAGVRMVTAGIPIRVIQTILGHADITTTMRYTEVFNQVAEIEMGKMRR